MKAIRNCVTSACALLAFSCCAGDEAARYFVIHVVDEQTGRGVPMIELRTVSEQCFVTDSNGIVAMNEPALQNLRVYFSVSGHGYEYPKDGFGFRGVVLDVKNGTSATLKVKRINIAERLYRITGEGIYRDTVLLGRAAPIQQPVINAQISGQDSVQMVEYRGKLRWFWGDTNRVAYPLGHYATSGATSARPADGLDPNKGIDLNYFTDKSGFARAMVTEKGPGMWWIQGLMNVKDGDGNERMLCLCAHHKTLSEVEDRRLLLYNDEKEAFDTLTMLDLNEPMLPEGHTFKHKDGEQEYVYFCTPYALTRVAADFAEIEKPRAYEGFSCLRPGARFDKNNPALDRDQNGKLIWAWKKDTAPVYPNELRQLLLAKKISAEDVWNPMKDALTGKAVLPHGGTINYNAYRKKWIMIFMEHGGTSLLGEGWYSEADRPEGPWLRARKIITHNKYTFYNVKHHPQFDQEGGRYIYFEGTYTAQFSGATEKTPLYDYNQIMYRLDLADPRLELDK